MQTVVDLLATNAAMTESVDDKQSTYDVRATYSPEDNKLRIYPAYRLDTETYTRVKSVGYIWAPKQQCFVAPMWTPEREDIALELAGAIEDEDTSLVERAEIRAERFEDYSEKRRYESASAHANAEAIMEHIPFGQPILVGHHSERHARKDAERIENNLRKAVNLWQTSQYWQSRAQGAIRHAKYKERPDVRARRIKGLESDLRKQEKNKAEAETKLNLWSKDGLTLEQARHIANYCHMIVCTTEDGSRWSAWDVLRPDDERYTRCPSWTVEQVQAMTKEIYAEYLPRCERWIQHYQLRLAYERAMLTADGGTVADQTKPEVGGAVKCWVNRGAWCYIQKVNKVSITVLDNWGHGGGNFTRTIPLTDLQGVMTSAEVEAMRSSGRLVENTHKTGFTILDAPVKQEETPETQTQQDVNAELQEDIQTKIQEAQEVLKAGIQVKAVSQLFPTPEWLADAVVAKLAIEPGEKVLEPEAGTGKLVEAVLRVPGFATDPHSALLAVEQNQDLAISLGQRHLPRCYVLQQDFLSLQPSENPQMLFDVVLMNPPFDHGADVEHVRHALRFLKPGGRLAAIMSAGVMFRTDRATMAFRRSMEEHGGSMEELPDNSFKEEGTGVRTVLVTMTKR